MNNYFLISLIALTLIGCLESGGNNESPPMKVEIDNVGAGPKFEEFEIFSIKTSFSKNELMSKFPQSHCKMIKIFPDCEKFAPDSYAIDKHMGGSSSCEGRWNREGLFVEVESCTFVPDQFKEAAVSVVFFKDKIERLSRVFDTKKESQRILMAPIVDKMAKRLGVKADEKSMYDGFLHAWVARFNLGEARFQIESEERIAKLSGSKNEFARGFFFDRAKMNKELEPYFEKTIKEKRLSQSKDLDI